MDARNFKMAAEKASCSKKVVLCEEDIPGAKLPRENVEECTVPQLRRWLLCRGAKQAARKPILSRGLLRRWFIIAHLSGFVILNCPAQIYTKTWFALLFILDINTMSREAFI